MRTSSAPLRAKKLVIFDLDGTLTASKQPMRTDMAHLLSALLAHTRVAVIGGGAYRQFEKQLVSKLRGPRERFAHLFLFPTTGTAFYRFRGRWRRVYQKKFSAKEKKKIVEAFARAFRLARYVPHRHHHGRVFDDRGSQITFSTLGQRAPLAEKRREKLDRVHEALRRRIAAALQELLPGFEVRVGGLTSIDVTPKGIDKAYGVRRIMRALRVRRRDVLFVGDALERGGNDEAARRTGVAVRSVKGPLETKKIIRSLLQ